MLSIDVKSEIGHLEGVILHTPGVEIERMTPETIEEALYSDLLNLQIANNEYKNFEGVLSKWTNTFQVKDLLVQVLENEALKFDLINQILKSERKLFLMTELMSISSKELAVFLIQGYAYNEELHPTEYSSKRYILDPLYNFYFTRDGSSSVYNQVLINAMSHDVRVRESIIMESIFKNIFNVEVINPRFISNEATTEGGDILIAKDDVLLIGNGSRTNAQGIKFLINYFAARKQHQHILIQELPSLLGSYIHLDMFFTMLDKDKCMAYEPLIVKNSQNHKVTHVEIDNGKITYGEFSNFLEGLKHIGFDLEPISCGGKDIWNQKREQWHSGANFFALGEGKIIGYARNLHTIESLNNAGFEVLPAKDVCSGKIDLLNHKKFVVTVDAAELPRGGGGARCMTMPIKRSIVNW